jgi:hypothetical protein
MEKIFRGRSTFLALGVPSSSLIRKLAFSLSTILLLSVLSGCGGGDSVTVSGGDNGGEIIGTGFTGTAAIGTAIANAEIRIKSLSGESVTTNSGADGKFSSAQLFESSASAPRGPYLLRVDRGDGNYLYSVANAASASAVDSDTVSISVNIHPYTDLLIRNWFARQGRNIDSAFFNNAAIDALPSQEVIDAISAELLGILRKALSANGVIDNFNLLSTAFDADGQGFDGFLDDSRVIINNNIVNVIVAQQNIGSGIQSLLISNADLALDFTSVNDTPPSVPQNLRALAGNDSGEAVLVWEPSSDDKGVAGYNVYRDNVFVATTPYPVFTDTGLQSATAYSYHVKAVDGRDQESAQSNTAAITLSAPDITAPPAISDLEVEEISGFIALSWSHPDVSDVAGFRILRGAQGNVNTEIANVTATTYKDFDLLSGYSPCYRVIAYDAAGNESSASAETCLEVSGEPEPTDESILAFSSSGFSVEETQSSAIISVVRSGDLSQAASVSYSAIALSATANVDFAETSGMLSWAALDGSEKTFSVQIFNNAEAEGSETVSLALSDPVNAELGSQDSAELTITDAPAVSCIDLSPTEITSNTTLTQPCYNVNDNINVSSTATLTIAPGVKLVFAQGRSLDVDSDGVLKAIGTEQNPIIFTGALPSAGYWNGIRIDSVVTSELEHTVVEYAGADGFIDGSVGNAFGGRFSVKHSLIRHSSSYGVAVNDSSNGRLVAFENNTITLNELAPVYVPADQVGVLKANNNFAGNITDVGGNRDYIQLDSSSDSDVVSEQTWSVTDVPYRLSGHDIEGRLTLSPGVTLEFSSDGRFDVRNDGVLIADGSEETPITFTGIEKNPGFWTGVQIFNSTANLLNHVIIEYGGGSGGNTDGNIGVFFSDGQLTIRNTLLRHSASYGFDFDDGIELVFENVTSTNNNRPGRMDDINDVRLLDSDSDYSGNADDRIFLEGSEIITAQTIQKLNVPYYATRQSQILVSTNLSFAPGVELQFASSGGFRVGGDGSLAIVGTAEQPVLLTGVVKTKGYWNGIQYTFSDSADNRIEHAIIEYGGAESGNTHALVGYFGQTRGSVTNSVLRASLTNGIELNEDTVGDFVTGNVFEDIDGEDILDPR